MEYVSQTDNSFLSAVEKDTAEYTEARTHFINSVIGSSIGPFEKNDLFGIVGVTDAARAEYLLTQRKLGEQEVFDVVGNVAIEAKNYVHDMFDIALDHTHRLKFRGDPENSELINKSSDWDAEFYTQYALVEQKYASILKELVGEQVV